MNIIVLYGGDSPERDISIGSGKAIANAAENAGFKVILLDTKDGFKQIDKYKNSANYVFPILHGENGEDGKIQKYLEKKGFKFLGAGSEASKNSFDKIKTHEILEKVGIKMPNYAKVSLSNIKSNQLFRKPYVLKPIYGGSSLDTQIVRNVSSKALIESEKLL
jgi:D-alanine-D-alanine ligase